MKSIAEMAKEIASKNGVKESDYTEINEHVSEVLDDHLETISGAHSSNHSSNHYSQIN